MEPDFLLALLIGGAALLFGGFRLSRLAGPTFRRAARIRTSYEEARAELGRGVRLGELAVAGEAECPLCRQAVARDAARLCPSCATPCHPDCWDWNGGCAVYACAARRIPADR